MHGGTLMWSSHTLPTGQSSSRSHSHPTATSTCAVVSACTVSQVSGQSVIVVGSVSSSRYQPPSGPQSLAPDTFGITTVSEPEVYSSFISSGVSGFDGSSSG